MIAPNEALAGKPKKVCFSYTRFSSGKQAKGNSQDRQLEIAPRVAQEKCWRLDESLSLADLGLSAFKRANLGPKGSLGAVLTALRKGALPHGSVMIIEALDRLTRTQLDEAYDLFRDLLRGGLELYVDKGSRHYTRDSLKNPIDLFIAIVELNAANEYSANLSDRVGKAWQAKRERLAKEGERLTRKVVGWINPQTWKPIVKRVAIVRKIFSLYNGGHGISSIVRRLNADKIPTWGRGMNWNSSYISQILHSRAVIGEFQAHVTKSAETGNYYKRIKSGQPIENYYPAVVDRSIFYATQAKLGDNKKAPKTDTIGNLFSGVAVCECGQRMYLAKSQKGKNPRQYYMCWGKVKGLGCKAPSIHYEPIEMLFVATVAKNAHRLFRETPNIAAEVQSLTGELEDYQQQIENITKFVLDGAATKALVEKQAELEKLVDATRQKLDLVEARTGSAGEPETDFVSVPVRELQTNMRVRREMRDFVLAYVEKMEFTKDRKTVNLQFKSGEVARLIGKALKELGVKQVTSS